MGSVQDRPHAPQLPALARRSTSQPLVESRSQSPWPTSHEATTHRPEGHEGTPWAGAHSQPLLTLESQSAEPGSQVPTAHAPATHAATALRLTHVCPQAPQFATSRWRSRQVPPQSLAPTPHESWQVPMAHTRPVGQARPHPPQCATLVFGSTQNPPQTIWSAEQRRTSTEGPSANTGTSSGVGTSRRSERSSDVSASVATNTSIATTSSLPASEEICGPSRRLPHPPTAVMMAMKLAARDKLMKAPVSFSEPTRALQTQRSRADGATDSCADLGASAR